MDRIDFKQSWVWSVVIAFILLVAISTYNHYVVNKAPTMVPKTVTFNCDEGKNIKASFYIGDDRFVDLILSDGRKMSVPHAMSGSGARYANADESFVFWNKGDSAFITEGTTTTFANCNI